MSGSGNHQFGLKGYLNSGFKKRITQVKNHKLTEPMVYVGSWHKKNKTGRIKEYRFLVEACHTLFPDIYFEEIDGWFYLKDGYSVHHKDFNHENNSIFNLEILTRSEHSSLHNKLRNTPRNNKGQFVKHL